MYNARINALTDSDPKLYSLYIIVTFDKKRKKKKIMTIERSRWDSSTNKLIGRYNKDIERKLREYINYTEAKIEDLIKRGLPVLANVFKEQTEEITFTQFFEDFANTCELEGIEKSTKKNFVKVLNIWKEKVGDVGFIEVNMNLLLNFKKSLIAEGLHVNTIADYFKITRSVWNRGVKRELTEKPFPNNTDLGIKKKASQRLFLEKDELGELWRIYEENELAPRLHKVLEYFLFACYTGLRYGDVKDFSITKNVSDNYIRLKINKTENFLTIPLNSKSKILLDNIEDKFSVISNEKTNLYLKEIMLWSRIRKSISFHCARHTFATLALTLGVDIKTVSKLLDHATVRTTEIYAKIVDEKLVDAMSKFDDL